MVSFREATVVLLAVCALYLPSSVEAEISQPLTALTMAAVTALLSLLIVGQGLGAPTQVFCATGIVVSLGIATVTSPFTEVSPGLIPIFLSIAMLTSLRLPVRGDSKVLRRTMQLVHAVSLSVGYALVADVPWVDDLAVQWYSAFYPDLLVNMVVLDNKPVLTFGTHSMAGFMVYLLFYDAYTAWRLGRGGLGLAVAIGHLGLLVALTSTTSVALAGVATLQLLVRLGQRHRGAVLPSAVALGGALVIALVYAVATAEAPLEAAREAVLGTQVRGFLARYAADGLLAKNFEYLASHPFRPIGVTHASELYLGDSGVVLSLLRGSLPFTLFLYGGWFALCAETLSSRAAALWLTVLTIGFEIGFTPLQYLRFVGFMPLYFCVLESRLRAQLATDARCAS